MTWDEFMRLPAIRNLAAAEQQRRWEIHLALEKEKAECIENLDITPYLDQPFFDRTVKAVNGYLHD